MDIRDPFSQAPLSSGAESYDPLVGALDGDASPTQRRGVNEHAEYFMLPAQTEHFVLTPRGAEEGFCCYSNASSLGWPEDGRQDDPWSRDARWVDLTDA